MLNLSVYQLIVKVSELWSSILLEKALKLEFGIFVNSYC